MISSVGRGMKHFLPGFLMGGALVSSFVHTSSKASSDIAMELMEAQRKRLPDRVILLRHGESEGNADNSLYRTKPDNLIELTDAGTKQAIKAGERISKLLGPDERVAFITSPFERTLQTARNVRLAFNSQIVRTKVEPLIREQEFGNLQSSQFQEFRQEQLKVGRFWYRFPTGESGADVYTRVCLWWERFLLPINLRVGIEPVSTVVVVTHGLAMRLILMQLYGWSPNTFHTVWNAENCDMYVLKKNLDLPGDSPYALDQEEGDFPRSSLEVVVRFKNGDRKLLNLEDYLSLPAPRSINQTAAKELLSRQYDLDPDQMEHIDFFASRVGYDQNVPGPQKFR